VSTEYEAAMLARLRASRTEAARVVLDLYKSGRRMDDAVLDAIESMPRTKTVQLRRWSDNWKSFLEWMDLQAEGWKIVEVNRFRVMVTTPHAMTANYVSQEGGAAINDAVAAGADVGAVKFLNSEKYKKHVPALTAIYEVTRHL
jgi:hypothetical protein